PAPPRHLHPFPTRRSSDLPTLADLAAADEQEVLRLWEGLGYYRRARDLHAAAKLLMQRHQGRIPADAEALAALPGLGRYTRNARSEEHTSELQSRGHLVCR